MINNENKNYEVIFYGAVGSVTGSNFVLQRTGDTGKYKIMIDCGLFQGDIHNVKENIIPFPYTPSEFDTLVITHGHIDHIGRVPKLVRDGFKGTIISTPATKEIAEPMLRDALKVMEMNSHGDKQKIMYSSVDIEKALSLWTTTKYHEDVSLAEDFVLKFYDAGHILGSGMAEITYGTNTKKKILFTGDLGNSPSPIIKDTETTSNIDYLVMESVYGDRNHDDVPHRDDHFEKAITDGIKRGGTIVIPAFSLERSQVILYKLNNLIEDKKIDKIPVYLDSPLAIKLTAIYKKYQGDFNKEIREEISRGDDIFSFPTLNIVDRNSESREIMNNAGSKIILAGSGMSVGGRVLSHEVQFLPDPKSTIIFVGYQAMGTLGRTIQNGAKDVKIEGKSIRVEAHIESVEGYSSHKDSEHLIDFVSQIKPSPKKVFLVMGEPKASMFLSQRINDYLDIETICPEKGRIYSI